MKTKLTTPFILLAFTQNGGSSRHEKDRWGWPQAQTQCTVVALEMDGKAHWTNMILDMYSPQRFILLNELNFSDRTISRNIN